MKKILFLLTLAALLTGCSACKKYVPINDIAKGDLIFENRMEGAPVVFKGKLLYVISNRFRTSKESLEFYDENRNLVAQFESQTDLISALVYNDELYIFGTKGRKEIEYIKTKDLINFDMPVTVLAAKPSVDIFNTSVAVDSTGFVLAYETCEPGTVCFNTRFLRSTDLIIWTDTGELFAPTYYAACPTIRYLDGFYYLFYLGYDGEVYETFIRRSTDLINWSDAKIVLTPRDNKDLRSINNSDLDFIEYNGQVIIQYVEGNQANEPNGWSNIRGAIYPGSEAKFLLSFFGGSAGL